MIAVLSVVLTASPRNAFLVGSVVCILAGVMPRLTQSRDSRWSAQIQTLVKEILKVINYVLGAQKEVKVLHRKSYFLNRYYGPCFRRGNLCARQPGRAGNYVRDRRPCWSKDGHYHRTQNDNSPQL